MLIKCQKKTVRLNLNEKIRATVSITRYWSHNARILVLNYIQMHAAKNGFFRETPVNIARQIGIPLKGDQQKQKTPPFVYYYAKRYYVAYQMAAEQF
jgi:hypothetical protein